MKKQTLFVCRAGVVAAMYVCLNFVSSALGLSYSAVQFRLSEVLTVLPALTPAAIPGLVIGCMLANAGSPLGITDVVTGAAATLAAAALTRLLRKYEVKGIPLFAFLPPVIVNALAVGAEIAVLTGEGFAVSALFVALGEAVVVSAGGIPFYAAVRKTNLFR